MTVITIEHLVQIIGKLHVELELVRTENEALKAQLGPGKDGLPIYNMEGELVDGIRQ